jgi:RNA 3'-phosphate cyclase
LLKIDGSYGEGGGQILRNAIALSTLLNKPVKITKIRANRPNPGMKAQHYVAIKSIAELCDADVSGLEIGSSSISFKPGEVKGGKYSFDIGTAGSITLVFQACILASLKSKEPVTISLKGGTDVKWSPTWDYFQYVFLPLLQKIGIKVHAKLILRGYYPKGGGDALIMIDPCEKLQPLQLANEQEYSEVNGKINLSNLPEHIASRMKHTAIRGFLKNDILTSIDVEETKSLSPGVGITLWSQTKDTIIGATVLGEKSVSSEDIGQMAMTNLLKEIQSNSTLDVYAFDQLLPYMALARDNSSSSCFIRELSSHASTNMWLLQQFLDIDFEAVQNEDNFKITVK